MNFLILTDTELLQCLIYGEARGECIEGKIAVGCVVRNRVDRPAWWGKTWQEVMLKPKQFSCFNNWGIDLTSTKKFLTIADRYHPVWRECWWVAYGIRYRNIRDITSGATHFHSGKMPRWAYRLTRKKVIGNHIFYK